MFLVLVKVSVISLGSSQHPQGLLDWMCVDVQGECDGIVSSAAFCFSENINP